MKKAVIFLLSLFVPAANMFCADKDIEARINEENDKQFEEAKMMYIESLKGHIARGEMGQFQWILDFLLTTPHFAHWDAINSRGKDGWNLLSVAAYLGNFDATQILLNRGAKRYLNPLGYDRTPIEIARIQLDFAMTEKKRDYEKVTNLLKVQSRL